MTPSPQPLETPLPTDVTAALRRLCTMVEAGDGRWTIGGAVVPADGGSLGDCLYERWYTQPAEAPAPASEDPPLHRRSLLCAFRAAHAGAAEVSPGWTVLACDRRGALSAAKGESSRMLQPGEYTMPLRTGAPPAPGEPVEPLAREDYLDAERGIWWGLGGPPPEPPKGRLYFDVRPATAPRAVREITAALQGDSYQLKCPVDAGACQRVDALVVYHPRAVRERAIAALLERWDRLGPLLDPAVPPLTCEVRPGFSWADEIEEERSFGQTRCDALAAAMAAAASTWLRSDGDGRLEILLAGIEAAGIDPRRPWESEG